MSAVIKLSSDRIQINDDVIVNAGQLGVETTIGGTITNIDLASLGRIHLLE